MFLTAGADEALSAFLDGSNLVAAVRLLLRWAVFSLWLLFVTTFPLPNCECCDVRFP